MSWGCFPDPRRSRGDGQEDKASPAATSVSIIPSEGPRDLCSPPGLQGHQYVLPGVLWASVSRVRGQEDTPGAHPWVRGVQAGREGCCQFFGIKPQASSVPRAHPTAAPQYRPRSPPLPSPPATTTRPLREPATKSARRFLRKKDRSIFSHPPKATVAAGDREGIRGWSPGPPSVPSVHTAPPADRAAPLQPTAPQLPRTSGWASVSSLQAGEELGAASTGALLLLPEAEQEKALPPLALPGNPQGQELQEALIKTTNRPTKGSPGQREEFVPESSPECRGVLRLPKGSPRWATGPGKVGGPRPEGGGQPGAGAPLTLLHVEHVHRPEELGLPVQPTLPQASQAVQAVVQGHEAGEGPLAGDIGELGPGAGLNVKDLEGVDGVLGLSSPWRPQRSGGWAEE